MRERGGAKRTCLGGSRKRRCTRTSSTPAVVVWSPRLAPSHRLGACLQVVLQAVQGTHVQAGTRSVKSLSSVACRSRAQAGESLGARRMAHGRIPKLWAPWPLAQRQPTSRSPSLAWYTFDPLPASCLLPPATNSKQQSANSNQQSSSRHHRLLTLVRSHHSLPLAAVKVTIAERCPCLLTCGPTGLPIA